MSPITPTPGYVELVHVDGLGDVPKQLADALLAYALAGHPVGDTLRAFLCNDLQDAVARSDQSTLSYVRELCQLIYNYLPGECWGDSGRVAAWMEKGGYEGLHPEHGLPPELNRLRLACEETRL